MVQPRTIIEVRDAGRVRAAAVLEVRPGRLAVLTPEGREVRISPERVVHETGRRLPDDARSPEAIVAALRAFEAAADRRTGDVDLAELHAFLLQSAEEDASVRLDAVDLPELAPLALGASDAETRAAVHRALAAPNPFFRFTGRHWQALLPAEVERESARLAEARRLERERAAFVHAGRTLLSGGDAVLPEGSEKFLRPLRELAIHGDSATTRKEAGRVFAELTGSDSPSAGVTPDRAFETLRRLGLFERDQNLAILRAGIAIDFPADVLAEAARAATVPLDLDRRLDLRELEVITIDDAATREVDDGLSLQATPRGVRLGIHIADAAHFVRKGTRLDEEALERATSFYLPGQTIPMLPPAVAEDAASLVEGADRPALSFLVELTPHGEILRTEVAPSAVRVTRRLSYDDCEAILSGTEPEWEWVRELGRLRDELEAARLAAGASPMRAPEVDIKFDAAGDPLIRLIDPGRPARQLVSEMMILANRVAAEWCRDRGLPAVYRRQAPADAGVPVPARDRYDPVAIHRFRRALQRTEVGLEPGPHSSLGLPCYLQATSPIRRYQDLAVHRMLKAAHHGEPLPHSREELQAIAATTEQAGRLARQVEAETDAYWILRALEARQGEVLEGIVLRTDGRRTHVELVEYAHGCSVPARPDHEAGATLALRVRVAQPRRGVLTLEEAPSA